MCLDKGVQTIPLHELWLSGKEIEYIKDAINRRHISGYGRYTEMTQTLLEKSLSIQKVLLTTSCTKALEMSALLLDIKAGDEVIVPSFTFISTANAFAQRGAIPIFVDIRPDTLNLDEERLESLITNKTKAIIPVHYAGIGCEMDKISDIARRNNVAIIEDNAHGLFGKYKGKYLGSMGCMAALSFDGIKNFTCGEGGALIINDDSYVERAEIIRDCGSNRAQFLRGVIDGYGWIDLGSKYLLPDILAAFLYAQLEAREMIQGRRSKIWNYYYNELTEWADSQKVKLPAPPTHCESSFHIFYLIMESAGQRSALISHLAKLGVIALPHFPPLHLSKMGSRYGGRRGDCPVAEKISNCMLRIPLYPGLTDLDIQHVIKSICSFSKIS